ncbi:MAG: sel1 repeat family protein [Alphaproteobacteria bacterium]
MKRWVLAGCIHLLLIGSALAGTAEALKALERGDGATAVRELTPEGHRGDPDACERLGDIHADGLGGVAKDGFAARDWYFQAARRGQPESQYKLAQLYAEGKGIGRDPRRAEDWFTAAARQRHARAQLSLGKMYLDRGYDPVRKMMRPYDAANAYYWLMLAEHFAKDDSVRTDATTTRQRLAPMMPKDTAPGIEQSVRMMLSGQR